MRLSLDGARTVYATGGGAPIAEHRAQPALQAKPPRAKKIRADKKPELVFVDDSKLRAQYVELVRLAAAKLGNKKPLAVLDLYCGSGVGSDAIREAFGGCLILGSDPSPRMQALAASRGVVGVSQAGSGLNLPDASVDLVLCTQRSTEWKEELLRILRPGGIAILAGELIEKSAVQAAEPIYETTVTDGSRAAFERRFRELDVSVKWLDLGARGVFAISAFGRRRKSHDDFMLRLSELASDPAGRKNICAATIEEAAVGLIAELDGVVPGPIRRESSGKSEFIDGDGVEWDVKSPLSPPEGARWSFDAKHVLGRIRHDFEQGENVLLNLTRVSKADQKTLLVLLGQELSDTERGKLRVLVHSKSPMKSSTSA